MEFVVGAGKRVNTCLFLGLEETLLISSKPGRKKATTLQTVRVPRSNGKCNAVTRAVAATK